MRKGRIEEAGAMATKIGTLIIKHNSNKLKSVSSKETKSLWTEVNKTLWKRRILKNQY